MYWFSKPSAPRMEKSPDSEFETGHGYRFFGRNSKKAKRFDGSLAGEKPLCPPSKLMAT